MIIDSHTHFTAANYKNCFDELLGKMLFDMDSNKHDMFNVLLTENNAPSDDEDRDIKDKLASGFKFKSKFPERVFLFGCLSFKDLEESKGQSLVEQLDKMIEAGCDGIKLLFGKPDSNKYLKQALCSPLFEPLFARLEERQFPIVWHIADPEEFWDEKLLPVWAKGKNWSYDDSFPSYEQLKDDAERVFEKHPRLNLILAHFYFMSEDLGKAAEFLDKHPNIYLDLAPGVEMCHNFSSKIGETRAFFAKYADRLIYGTDSGMSGHATSFKRSKMIQEFLTTSNIIQVPTDDPFMMPDAKDTISGIYLDENITKKIFAENFLRVLGYRKPLGLNMECVKEICG